MRFDDKKYGPARRAVRWVVKVTAVAIRRRITRGAAQLAYFLILTFFPLLICLNAAAGALSLREN